MMHSRMIFNVFILIWILLKFSNAAPLSITKVSTFPHNIHKHFNISLNYSIESFGFGDTLVIRISDEVGNQLDEAAFDYRIKNEIDEIYSGEFLTVSKWKKNPIKKIILASLIFNKRSDNQFIEILDIQVNSEKVQNLFPENYGESKLLYRSKIKLITPTKLKLTVNSVNGKLNEFNEGQIGVASCRLIGHTQESLPVFINIKNFTIKQSSLSLEKKERKFEFFVSLADHMKEIICKSGNNVQRTKLKVFHPPSKVKLEPEIKDKLFNDTKVSCGHLNGYPVPVTQWIFLNGPSNASDMYKITQGGQHLKVTVSRLDNSSWSFNCTAKNVLSNSIKWFNKTISFLIIENTKNKKINSENFEPIRKPENSTNHNELLLIKNNIQVLSKLTKITEQLVSDNKNFSAALKETNKMNARLNLEVNELKKSCSIKKEKLRSSNKNEFFESAMKRKDDSIEIRNLKENLEVLKKKINEITELLNKNNLVQPISKPQQLKRIQTKPFDKIKGYPPFGILPVNEWKINQIQQKRKKAFPIFGNFFYADYNANKMMMLFFPNGYKTTSDTHLTVILQLIFAQDSESYRPFQGDIIIGIYNSQNQYLNKIISIYSLLNRQMDRSIFNFKYDELMLSGVLANNEIIIKCFVNVKY